MNIAIIPARANSRRIKNKNIIDFFGKELIFYSISAAIRAKIFDEIIVSTDSTKIANISKKYGAKVYFKRPRHLSENKTGLVEVIKHAIKYLEIKNKKVDTVCCILPTAPLIEKSKLIKGYKLFKKKKPDFLISAVNYQLNYFRSFFSSSKKKTLKKIFPSKFNKKFYNKKIYYDAGQFYFAGKKTWLKSKSVFTKRSMIIEIKEELARDLNTLNDLSFLKLLYKNKKKFNN